MMADETSEELQEPTAAAKPEGGDAALEEAEDFEPVSLSARQWIYVSLAILASFLFFAVVFFPAEDLVRYVAYRILPGLSFQHLDLNYFGKDHIEKISFHQGGMSFEAGEIESGLGWFSLARRYLKGPVIVRSIELSHPVLNLKAAKLRLDSDLGPLGFSEQAPNPLSGSLKLLLQSATLGQIAPLGIEAGLVKIKEGRIHIVMQEGALDLRDFSIKSNIFRIEIQNGSLGSSRNLATSPLRGKLCLTPMPPLRDDEKFAGIRTIYELSGGNINERFCTELTGTFGKPGIKSKPPAFVPENESTPGINPPQEAPTQLKPPGSP